jgi:putative nucleotidyltransferase with HDIG domain
VRERILELVRTNPNLPPLPEILLGLQKLIDDPDCEVEDVYRLLKADTVLSGRLITLANSALFGSGRDESKNLEDAVVRLGMKQVMDLVYALELPGTFKKSKAFDQIEFWKHSMAVAFITRSLAKKVLTNTEDLESSFLAGLMHDVGILVLDNIIPDEYHKFLTLKDLSSSDVSLELIEQDEFEISHPEVGAEFMKKWWSLPPKVASAALSHHEKGPVKGEPLTLDQIVSTANRIANMNEFRHPVATAFKDLPEEGYLDALEISQEELDIVIDTTVMGLMAAETLLRSH